MTANNEGRAKVNLPSVLAINRLAEIEESCFSGRQMDSEKEERETRSIGWDVSMETNVGSVAAKESTDFNTIKRHETI